MLNKCAVFLKRTSCSTTHVRSKWTAENLQVFAQLFDLSERECKQYKRVTKLPALTKEHLQATVALCESTGIPKQDWLKYPILLRELAHTLEQEYLQLKEGGFVNITAEILARYRKCIRKKISFLKLHSLIPQHVNVAESFASYLQPKPSDFSLDDLTDDDSFAHTHHSVLTRYLMWRCNASQDAIEKFFRVYSLARVRSLDFLSQNFAIAEDLGLPPEKLLKNGYLLTMYPKYPQTVLSEMPIVAGMDIRAAMKMYPKLIATAPRNYTETYKHLKKAGVGDDAIQKCMNIFLLSPQTVKTRLDEIESVPELRVLLNNPRVLKLIIHHNQARSRLSFLQQVKLKCATVAVLGRSQEIFNVHLREGKDVNSSQEIVFLVKHLLKANSKAIKVNLKKHRHYRNVPLLTIQDSYRFLRSLDFTNQAISDVVQLMLYPRCKIKTAYEQIDKVTDRNTTLVEKLNLMLYLIEKDYHFTGDGVWPDDKELG